MWVGKGGKAAKGGGGVTPGARSRQATLSLSLSLSLSRARASALLFEARRARAHTHTHADARASAGRVDGGPRAHGIEHFFDLILIFTFNF